MQWYEHKPSELAKECGLSSLQELSEITQVSTQTLGNWSKDRPELYRIVVIGAVHDKYARMIEKVWQ